MKDMVLRDLKNEDENIIFKWISNRELRKMTGTRGEPDVVGHGVWFKRKVEDKSNLTKVITFQDKSVGIIGTNEINYADRNASIYIYIGSEEYRKKGIASAALESLCGILFDELGMHKIVASIRSYNLPSIKLFEKNGFTCEGIQKEQILYDGQYYDRLLYGKLNNSRG